MAGFGGGLVALSFGQPLTWGRKVFSVAVSTISAAYMAPAGLYLLPLPDTMPESIALKALAFVIGLGAQKFLPALIERGRNVVSGQTSKPASEN